MPVRDINKELSPEPTNSSGKKSLHAEILEKIMDRFRYSYNEMSQRYYHFAEMENRYRAYRPASELDRLRSLRRDEGSPQFTTVEVPYSYALLLTQHSFLSNIFLGRSPALQYMGIDGEGEMNKYAVEAIMNHQMDHGGLRAPSFVWLLDPGRYGFGVTGTYWDEEERIISHYEDKPAELNGIPIPGKTQRVKVNELVRGYMGNRTYNIRPQDFFPDPRVPMNQSDDWEFCGRTVEVGENFIRRMGYEKTYFNTDFLIDKNANLENAYRDFGSDQNMLPQQNRAWAYRGKLKNFHLLEMYIELVPKQWKLGESEKLEKWVFVVGNFNVILLARPYGSYYDKYPFDVIVNEVDTYQLFHRSLLEITEPLNNALSWMFNTHIYNVRKALNDQVVYDPSRILGKDLRDPGAGRLVRMKPAGYGTPIGDSIKQLQVVDITQTHLRDIPLVTEMMQRVTGVTDDIVGVSKSSSRRSATESRQSAGFAMNRLRTLADWYSIPWNRYAYKLLVNTQQYLDAPIKARIAGDTAAFANRKFLEIDPESIMGGLDFIPVDPNQPIDKVAMTNTWIQLMGTARQIPEIATQYNFPDIFMWVAQLAGLKNIQQFKINVVPDQQLQNQQQQGNVVPLGAPKNPPTQIPGVGPTA